MVCAALVSEMRLTTVFHEMLDQCVASDVFTCNVLISALAKMDRCTEVKELFSLMIQIGQTPNM